MPYITSYKKQELLKPVDTLNDFTKILQEITDGITTVKQRETQTYFIKNTTVYSFQTLQNLNKVARILEQLKGLYNNKASHFNVFQIPKATGGFRTIKAPDDALKDHYTRIAKMLQIDLKMLTHNNAYAYVTERSTVDAIKQHQANTSQYFLKVDVEKFFDNCTPMMISTQLQKIHPLNHHTTLCDNLADFATLDNGLPQGTPLSPILTNLIMIPFDYQFSQWCKEHNLIYTRYADDLIISSKESFKFKTIIEKINKILEKENYGLTINNNKTRYGNRNGQNWNLGLMLNHNNDITLGHEFKHRMKNLLHKVATGEMEKQNSQLIGLLSYLKMVEPNYYIGLNNYCKRKYRASITQLIK